MTGLADALGVARRALTAEGLEFAVIGGLAVSIQTRPRYTEDIDVAVAVDGDAGAESVVRRLISDGHDLVALLEQESADRVATARFHTRDGDELDLLFASSGIEPEVVAAAAPLEVLPGLTVPVATVGHLIALKLLSRSEERPLDQADLLALRAIADPADLAVAAEAVALIAERGYDRGRDLVSALSELVG